MFSISNLQFLKFKIQSVTIFKFKYPNFQFQISKSQISNLYNSKLPISKPQFRIFKLQIHFRIIIFQYFKLPTSKFQFKLVFKNSKHVINSIVPIKLDIVELICVTYKWAWVRSDISCILLTNNLTSNL